jgi:hypothetical protein
VRLSITEIPHVVLFMENFVQLLEFIKYFDDILLYKNHRLYVHVDVSSELSNERMICILYLIGFVHVALLHFLQIIPDIYFSDTSQCNNSSIFISEITLILKMTPLGNFGDPSALGANSLLFELALTFM